jgi:hypothetical protein
MSLVAIVFLSVFLSLKSAVAETPKIIRHLVPQKKQVLIFCFDNNLTKGYNLLIVLCYMENTAFMKNRIETDVKSLTHKLGVWKLQFCANLNH